VFSTYVCRTIDQGRPHPGEVAEPASLAAVPLPPNDYPLWDAIPAGAIDSGQLSQLQLEGVRYACAKHLERIPSGERAGFFIGRWLGWCVFVVLCLWKCGSRSRWKRCRPHVRLLSSANFALPHIGDGAGVGKGRQIAAVALDNYVRGRR
jgi:hypothetical protein